MVLTQRRRRWASHLKRVCMGDLAGFRPRKGENFSGQKVENFAHKNSKRPPHITYHYVHTTSILFFVQLLVPFTLMRLPFTSAHKTGSSVIPKGVRPPSRSYSCVTPTTFLKPFSLSLKIQSGVTNAWALFGIIFRSTSHFPGVHERFHIYTSV
jgi:hypothetical protein